MELISSLPDDYKVYTGSILRLTNVKRLDVIAKDGNAEDDFYDLMLVDTHLLNEQTFSLINITHGNHNIGSVFTIFSDIDTRNWLPVSVLKKYFGEADFFLRS